MREAGVIEVTLSIPWMVLGFLWEWIHTGFTAGRMLFRMVGR